MNINLDAKVNMLKIFWLVMDDSPGFQQGNPKK